MTQIFPGKILISCRYKLLYITLTVESDYNEKSPVECQLLGSFVGWLLRRSKSTHGSICSFKCLSCYRVAAVSSANKLLASLQLWRLSRVEVYSPALGPALFRQLNLSSDSRFFSKQKGSRCICSPFTYLGIKIPGRNLSKSLMLSN